MKKLERESVSTTVRLPVSTHTWLVESAAGITDTIKRGLEHVEVANTADYQTDDFAQLVYELAREVEIETGAPWHANGASHRMFRRALLRAISKWRPSDYNDNLYSKVLVAPFRSRPHATHPLDDADELGVALADMVLNTPDREQRGRLRTAQEETLREIVKLQQTRGAEGND